jgi:hypothetical protein
MAFNPLDKIKDAAERVQKNVAYTVDSTKASVRDAALDAKDAAVGSVVRQMGKAVDLGRSLVDLPYIEFPISIAFMVAPVPLAIGVGMIALMEYKLEGSQGKIHARLYEAKRRRHFDRTVALLQKHGRIPETAVLETEHIRLEISSQSVEVKGEVKTGPYAGRWVQTLEEHDLDQMIDLCTDPETQQILYTYRTFRHMVAGMPVEVRPE